jgi:hypothetical protein
MSARKVFDGDKMEVAGNGTEEGNSVDIEDVKADGDVAVCLKDAQREGSDLVRWNVLWGSSGGLSSDGSNIGAIDMECSGGVIGGDGTILS